MPKPEIEFKDYDTHYEWRTVEGDTLGIKEKVLIVEGSLYDMAKKETFLPGYYACRPPGMTHGPYKIPYGCVTFEIRYHK